jgi:uncharacterized membrane protein
MDFRLHEVHPALVHFPIALMPLSIGADLLGKVTGIPGLSRLGRQTIAPAAVSALAAGLAGLVAQEHVNLKDDAARQTLITHRNLNLVATVGAGLMAWRRLSLHPKSKPSFQYLGTGLGLLAGLSYTAYLGGELVYRHGAGIETADGIYEDPSVAYRHDHAGDLIRQGGKSLMTGTKHLVQELGKGEIAPTLKHQASPRAGE